MKSRMQPTLIDLKLQAWMMKLAIAQLDACPLENYLMLEEIHLGSVQPNTKITFFHH